MAVQKKRKTRSRRDMRRSQIKAKKPSITNDEVTGETHIRHTISPQGFYRVNGSLLSRKKSNWKKNRGVFLSDFITLSLDVMSGDKDPEASINAALNLLELREDVKIFLVGNKEIIEKQTSGKIGNRLQILHADEVVQMSDPPVVVLRKKKQSSMRRAVDLVKDGASQACVSSGNTGALMAISKYVLKTIPTIDRPALMTSIPTIKGSTYVLDLGANSNCTPEQLYQFALMGDVVAREIRGIDQPRIGLLNMGEEAGKGNQVIKEAANLMNSSSINFIGYIEGNSIAEGKADVVVTDGFTGNIALKTVEGSVRLVFKFVEDAFNANAYNKFSSMVSKPALDLAKDKIDPRRYNGALLLGLNGVVVKSHGDSDAFGVHHALITAIEEVQSEIVSKLIGAF
jgi:glycerol-3-phosphate acyltransferase PlsX